MLRQCKRLAKKILLNTLWAFDTEDVLQALASVGVRRGDTIMVHNAWHLDSGFRGTPAQLVQAFIDAVGSEGTLAMMNIPFHNMRAVEYLRQGKTFDVRRTVSKVGLLTEVFRRRDGVRRSLHPTHSVAALGKGAETLLAGHEDCVSPFGTGSPFDKLCQAGGKIVLYDVQFNTMTFTHHLEDAIQDLIPVPLYEEQPISVPIIDYAGETRVVFTRVLTCAINTARRNDLLEQRLRDYGTLRETQIGRVKIMGVDTAQALDVVKQGSKKGSFFHVVPPEGDV